ncbi:hypothetical protein [Sediminitomix flava]|uniref:Uncharacterized protein n=1 Tax=Sediminitomix flava TaxID=379075 RepID=A0A315YLW7_SEDFL|nr:hypothetical protein [Sediminitomix flava]PWJ28750.1 hypothetical protein BC781_1361 [Sediminitomix flava]
MKLTTFILKTFLITILFICTSCGAYVKMRAISKITVENDAIPPDFGTEETILLCVITGKKGYDKYMKKHVSNEYHGKYEFVMRKDINSDKYQNTSKYKYLFDFEKLQYKTTHSADTPSGFETITITTASYYLFDRDENITYKCPNTSSYFSRIIQAYMINLENERIKNQ